MCVHSLRAALLCSIGDLPVPFPFRPFNRLALKNADGNPYVRSEIPMACKGGDNPWYGRVPEPKYPGDPDWLIEKIKALDVEGTLSVASDSTKEIRYQASFPTTI